MSVLDRFAVPVCAVCKREVDEIMSYRDEMLHCMVFVVRCHGAEQQINLDDSILLEATRISMGEAFATKELTS
jgi:hypothetical protein